MALVKPIIFQIVGFQNSGKTTIMAKILKELKTTGIKAVSIKHHGHGGKPDVADQKDSARHIEHGAIAAIVEGDGRVLLQAEKTSWTLHEEIRLMEFFDPEIILIEGYKKESYPKVLLVREEEDIDQLIKLANIQFIMLWNNEIKEQLTEQIHKPCYQIDDPLGIKEIVSFLQNKID
jgi:molybdopterin-guanine dinucleotide biosynthesis protein B